MICFSGDRFVKLPKIQDFGEFRSNRILNFEGLKEWRNLTDEQLDTL